MLFAKKEKINKDEVFLNHPISNTEEDWIGISTYVEKLDEAIEKGARIVAITSDYGMGKSSLISLYKSVCDKNNIHHRIKRKEVTCINMWGDYERVQPEESTDNTIITNNYQNTASIELHKAFIYQVISQLFSNNGRKSNYISKRLSKDFGLLSLISKSALGTFISTISFVGIIVSFFSYRFLDYIAYYFKVDNKTIITIITITMLLSIYSLGFVVLRSEILFSSKKSEGNRELDENILIDLYKQEVLNRKKYVHNIIVIEDLDRIDDKENVILFLRELRKYYLTECRKKKVTFVVCIKPESMLRIDSDTEMSEYKKIFDYTINLQTINIDNYDSILEGLLNEKSDWLIRLDLEPHISTPGMEWMIHGKSIDIREVKIRLNETLTLYESLLDRFPKIDNKAVISFERCAIATYLRREFENDFFKLKDDAFDLLVSQLAIQGMETIEEGRKPQNWDNVSDLFKERIRLLIKSKKIDENYRLYFYNYPRNSKLFTISELHVYNSIVYQETPKDKTAYNEYLSLTPKETIEEAYKRISSLGVIIPQFILDYDKLFVLLYNYNEDKFFELIEHQKFDKNNEERICSLIEKCIKKREGDYDWDNLINKVAQIVNRKVEDKDVLCAIRQRMCNMIPQKVRLLKNLFLNDNPLITSDEVATILNVNEVLDVMNYEILNQNSSVVESVHKRIMRQKEWNSQIIDFYVHVIECQGIRKWKDELINVCVHFDSIPDRIYDLFYKGINSQKITINDYVECLERVKNVEETQLQVLCDYHWVDGLSQRLCELLYQAGLYMEYVCNISQLEQVSITFDDDIIYDTIKKNVDWIKEKAVKSYYSIRIKVLEKHMWIEKYKFLFLKPYPIILQDELLIVRDVEDALGLLQERDLTEEQANYVVGYFNLKYRKPTTSYKIIKFILKQKSETAKEMFYSMNLSNIAYARMSSSHKKDVIDETFELFQMEDNPSEIVRFLQFTGISTEKMEKDLWKVLNSDEELRKVYVKYVNQLKKVYDYTLKNILKLDYIYAYSPVINQKFWERKEYEMYISSKTLFEREFVVEEDKIGELWQFYVNIFNSSNLSKTREYMIKNDIFMKRLIESKGFLEAKESIIFYAYGNQSVDLLNYVIGNCDEKKQVEYFSKVRGFDGPESAHRFCEIANKYRVIGESTEIYENVKGKLINPGLEGWITKIHKKKIK